MKTALFLFLPRAGRQPIRQSYAVPDREAGVSAIAALTGIDPAILHKQPVANSDNGALVFLVEVSDDTDLVPFADLVTIIRGVEARKGRGNLA